MYIFSQPAYINSPRFCILNMTFRNQWRGVSQLQKKKNFFFKFFSKVLTKPGWDFLPLSSPTLTDHSNMKNLTPPRSISLAHGGQVEGDTQGIS